MIRTYQHLVIFLGLFAGAFLFYIGFRKLFKKEESLRGRNLFILAVAFALAMLGAEPVPGQEPCPERQKKIGQVQKPATFEEKVELLEKTEEWNKLKELWQEMDRIDTFKKAKDGEPKDPFGVIDGKTYLRLSGKLEENIKGMDTLVDKKHLSKKTASLLKKICRDRLEHIRRPNPRMMCRSMPTPAMTVKPKTFSFLEAQIDSLLKLKSESKISEKVFRKAQDNIKNAINKIIVLDIIPLPRAYQGPLISEDKDIINILAKEMASLEKFYKSQSMGKDAYKVFKENLEEMGISIDKLEFSEAETRITETEKAVIEKLIDSLGSDGWRAREEAAKKLASLGKRVIPFLEKVKSGEDVEVRVRAGKIIEGIKRKAVFERFEKTLDKFNCLILRLIK